MLRAPGLSAIVFLLLINVHSFSDEQQASQRSPLGLEFSSKNLDIQTETLNVIVRRSIHETY